MAKKGALGASGLVGLAGGNEHVPAATPSANLRAIGLDPAQQTGTSVPPVQTPPNGLPPVAVLPPAHLDTEPSSATSSLAMPDAVFAGNDRAAKTSPAAASSGANAPSTSITLTLVSGGQSAPASTVRPGPIVTAEGGSATAAQASSTTAPDPTAGAYADRAAAGNAVQAAPPHSQPGQGLISAASDRPARTGSAMFESSRESRSSEANRSVSAAPLLPARVSMLTNPAAAPARTPLPLSGEVAVAATAAGAATPAATDAQPSRQPNAAAPMPSPTAGNPQAPGPDYAPQANGGKGGGLSFAGQEQAGAVPAGSPAESTTTVESGRPVFGDLIERQATPRSGGEARSEAAPATTQTPGAVNHQQSHTPVHNTHAGAHTPQAPTDQVAVRLRAGLSRGADHISIRLKPAALGHVDIKLHVAGNGHVSAAVTVDRPDTLDLLQRDARALERALQDAGLRTDSNSLSFNLRGEGRFAQTGSQTPEDYGSGFAATINSETEDVSAIVAGGRPAMASNRALDIEV
ncbi:MAG: flagellar hook-length control protein FliK [Alphaproteobacteria bacterium]